MVSGILFAIRNGLRWRDGPASCGPHKGHPKSLHPLEHSGHVYGLLAETGGAGR